MNRSCKYQGIIIPLEKIRHNLSYNAADRLCKGQVPGCPISGEVSGEELNSISAGVTEEGAGER